MEFIYNFLIFLLVICIIFLVLTIIYFISTWKLYKKAGYKGWESIIPFYNTWILIKIAELNEWYFLALLAPTLCSIIAIENLSIISYLIYITANFFVCYNISKKFNKDLFFTILMVIFPYIIIPILGFSKDCIYDKNIKVSKNGPISDNTTSNKNNNQNNNNQIKYCNSCGNNIDNNANFCRYCGNKINENQ